MSSVLFDIPGPKARARHRLIMIVSVVLTLLALVLALHWLLQRRYALLLPLGFVSNIFMMMIVMHIIPGKGPKFIGYFVVRYTKMAHEEHENIFAWTIFAGFYTNKLCFINLNCATNFSNCFTMLFT